MKTISFKITAPTFDDDFTLYLTKNGIQVDGLAPNEHYSISVNNDKNENPASIVSVLDTAKLKPEMIDQLEAHASQLRWLALNYPEQTGEFTRDKNRVFCVYYHDLDQRFVVKIESCASLGTTYMTQEAAQALCRLLNKGDKQYTPKDIKID